MAVDQHAVLDTARNGASTVESNGLKRSTVWSIRGEGAFAEVRATGRSVRHGRLVVVRADGQDGLPASLGLIVGKAVGNAVVRNRVRRQIKSIVREISSTQRGARYVVRALPGAGDQSYGALRASFNHCLEGFSS